MDETLQESKNFGIDEDMPIHLGRDILPCRPLGHWGEERLTPLGSSSQRPDALPRIYKVSPPPMQNRYLQPNLVTPVHHLRRHQSYTPPNPLDMLLPVKRRQHQIPQPIRQIVSQLRTQEIHPVGHKASQGQMAQKLIRKLTNPPLHRPPSIMRLHQQLSLAGTIGHHYIIRISQGGEEYLLSPLLFLLAPHQKPKRLRPIYRLIPNLGI